MSERKYLPTLGDLLDRLSIVLMKTIFIPQHREDYKEERDLILHDIDLLLGEEADGRPLTAKDFHAAMVLMLANRVIWENESIARNAGGDQSFEQFRVIRSINGVRVAAKNRFAHGNDRREWKVDMIANDIPPQFGKWDGLFDVG